MDFGERLAIRLVEVTPSRSIAVITRKPKLPTTLFDFGKNDHNVAWVADALAEAVRAAR